MMKIGFVGLGHMGAPMARNLLKAGHRVTVFDINKDACRQLETEGAINASSIAELAEGQNVLFTMLQTGAQVSQVALGKEGLFQHALSGALFIDCSSIDVGTSRDINAQARTHGLAALDAPVSGGVAGAQAATLTFMVGGEQAHFERAKALLDVMGKNIIHAGPAGTGQAAKICNNMILGISMAAISEAFTLAENLGLAPEKLYDISSTASGQCWAMTSYCPVPGILENVPSSNDYQAGFTAAMMLKDLRLSQQAAHETQSMTTLGETATELYRRFVDQGNSDIDFSAIIKMIAQK